MACRDFYDDHPEQYFKDVTEPALKKQISFAESALCAALDALEASYPTDFMDKIDYVGAGIAKKDLVKWRKEHKALDAKHRAMEEEKLKKRALAKLSDEEKKVLGLR